MLHFTIKKRKKEREWEKDGHKKYGSEGCPHYSHKMKLNFICAMIYGFFITKKYRKTSWGNNSHLWTSWAQMMCNWNRQWTRARERGEALMEHVVSAPHNINRFCIFFFLVWFGLGNIEQFVEKLENNALNLLRTNFDVRSFDRSNNHLSCAFDFLIVNKKRRSS